MKVWHITPDVGYGGNLLYNLTNKGAKEEKLRKYINKYELPENNSEYWWITLKEQYDAFFLYDWSVEKLQYSFEHERKDFGK